MSKKFTETSSFEPTTLMIVDGLNLAFRWKHAKSTDFVEDYISTVQSLRRSYKAEHVIITCDGGSSSYRKGIYPEYKQNRKDKIAQQTPEEEQEFQIFMEEFNRTMEEISSIFPVLRFPNVEADDIAALISLKAPSKYGLEQIWLISSDRDWDLLITPQISRFSYVTRKEVTYDNWNTHYDCTPEEYISMKCLMGDAGDNIPGIPSIGPKRAADLVREYGSAYDLYAALPIPSKYKFMQALNEHKERILLNYQLMDLVTYSEQAIGQENIAVIASTLNRMFK